MPILSALLSGVTPYIIGILLFVAAAAGGFGLWERSMAAEARTEVATQSATINEQQATIAADRQALAEIERIKDMDEAVIADSANQSAAVQSTLTQAETKVTHVKVTNCQSADARDAATLDGLRGILAATPAAGQDGRRQGTAASDPAGLPAAARDPGDTQQP